MFLCLKFSNGSTRTINFNRVDMVDSNKDGIRIVAFNQEYFYRYTKIDWRHKNLDVFEFELRDRNSDMVFLEVEAWNGLEEKVEKD